MDQRAYTYAVITIGALDRRRRENRDVGWVYVLRNPAFKEPILKIGQSKYPPVRRAGELSTQTGVPESFEVVYFVHVSNRKIAEAHVHRMLDEYRTSRSKEFFLVPLGLAVRALDHAAERYPIWQVRGRRRTPLPQCFPDVLIPCSGCGGKVRMKRLLVSVTVKCGACGSFVQAAASV